MCKTLSGGVASHYDVRTEGKRLAQAEASLGDHVTGGVVQRWRQVQRKLGDLSSEGATPSQAAWEAIFGLGVCQMWQPIKTVCLWRCRPNRSGCWARPTPGSVRIWPEGEPAARQVTAAAPAGWRASCHAASPDVVFPQHQLRSWVAQDSLASPVPSELADSYFLEEWQRLQLHWAELGHQRKTFERERQSFTEAAIRLSREVRNNQGSLEVGQTAKSQQIKRLLAGYLHGVCSAVILNNRRHLSWSSSTWATRPPWARPEEMAQKSVSTCFTAILYHHYEDFKMCPTVPGYCPQMEQSRGFGCLPITPPSKSGAARGAHQEGAGAQTPDTPELYSALNLSYNSRCVRSGRQSSGDRKMDEQNTCTWALLRGPAAPGCFLTSVPLSASRSSGAEAQSQSWDAHSAQRMLGSQRSPLLSYRLDRWWLWCVRFKN